MKSFFWAVLKDKKWLYLSYFTAGIILLFMFVSFYPSVSETAPQVSDLVKMLPEAVIKAFGLDPASFTTFEGFVSGKHFSLMWPILLLMISSSIAASAIARKIEDGTIEFELALPVSRTKIYLSKLLAGVAVIFLFVIFSVPSVIPISSFYNISINTESFYLLSIIGFLFGLSVLALSMLFSGIFSEKGKAIFASIAVLLAMYVVNIVALLNSDLEFLQYFSFMYYYNYNGILLHNSVENIAPLVFLGSFAAFGALGAVWFKRRDIAIT